MKAVREATKECGCEVIERGCEGTDCCDEAENYGIKVVPSIVVDGKIAHVGKLSAGEFRRYV